MSTGEFMEGSFWWWVVLVTTIISILALPGLLQMFIEEIKKLNKDKDE